MCKKDCEFFDIIFYGDCHLIDDNASCIEQEGFIDGVTWKVSRQCDQNPDCPYKLMDATVKQLTIKQESLDALLEDIKPFDDPYFTYLPKSAIAELAKKSIRLTTENTDLNTIIDRFLNACGEPDSTQFEEDLEDVYEKIESTFSEHQEFQQENKSLNEELDLKNEMIKILVDMKTKGNKKYFQDELFWVEQQAKRNIKARG